MLQEVPVCPLLFIFSAVLKGAEIVTMEAIIFCFLNSMRVASHLAQQAIDRQPHPQLGAFTNHIGFFFLSGGIGMYRSRFLSGNEK